jgi:exopolyphosphatase/guanosine-5'-triphosphate,3'-diphosphate pyrophosphatase
MLIADVLQDGAIKPVRDEHTIARLGKGVDENRMILPATFERVLNVLERFKNTSDESGSTRILARGTSALRDAKNQSEFIDFIKQKLDFTIETLSGDDEAELTYVGAVADSVNNTSSQNFAVLDIGGGSTELTEGAGFEVKVRRSVDMGSVRITERFLKSSPPSPRSIIEATSFIRSLVQSWPALSNTATLIGVAGTLTSLASIDLAIPSFDRERVHKHVLTFESIDSIFNKLRIKGLEELKQVPQILPERADIILAGILILLEVMKQMGAENVTVSDRGLRYGILMKEVQKG